MSQFIKFLALLAFLFVLTYDPKSRTLENIIEGSPKNKQGGCCSQVDYRADNPVQCEPPYYNGLQFADPDIGCPTRRPNVNMGAIL
jgi:hypothetical protein